MLYVNFMIRQTVNMGEKEGDACTHTRGCVKCTFKMEIKDAVVNVISTTLRPRLAPMWQQSGTSLFCSCHGIAGFLVDELQI